MNTKKTAAILLLFGLSLATGCHPGRSGREFQRFNGSLDLTNDLHHRIKAGLLQPDKEPVTLVLMGGGNDPEKPAPNCFVRFTWEGGTFWVKGDDLGRVNVYCDGAAIFGHIQIAGSQGSLGVQRDFFENPTHPIRPRFITQLVEPATGTTKPLNNMTFTPGE